jgi:hypothetical protein
MLSLLSKYFRHYCPCLDQGFKLELCSCHFGNQRISQFEVACSDGGIENFDGDATIVVADRC